MRSSTDEVDGVVEEEAKDVVVALLVDDDDGADDDDPPRIMLSCAIFSLRSFAFCSNSLRCPRRRLSSRCSLSVACPLRATASPPRYTPYPAAPMAAASKMTILLYCYYYCSSIPVN